MKAVIVGRYGRKDGARFGDMPERELRDDDVLVRVHAAAFCAIEFGSRHSAIASAIHFSS